MPQIVGTRPLPDRCGHGHQVKTSTAHFVAITFSRLHVLGAWTGAAPELLLSYARKVSYYPEMTGRYVAQDSPVQGGFLATGLPELAPGTEPDAGAFASPAAVIPASRLTTFIDSLRRAIDGPQH
ncbi:hypothetical protein [Streptomyces sp. NPDC026294]|uniref:hypothetical protein n=1 Tax=unclassified Streptomyces TaxID=2593676 RepID=UPI0033C00A0A